jgi:hypothetical protein
MGLELIMGYLQNSRCYLGGPIDNDLSTVNWRPPVIKELTNRFGINVFDPFNDPKQNKGGLIKQAKADRDKKRVQELVSGFVRKDLGVIDRSDFTISKFSYQDIYFPSDIFNEDGTVHIPSKPSRIQVPTTGTVHEVVNADLYHKPSLLICEEGWWNLPSWLLGFVPTQYWFSSWDEVYSYLDKVDKGGFMDDDRWHLVYGLV